ncbi:MAG: hypothetical protein ACOX2F_02590 [bacterium]
MFFEILKTFQPNINRHLHFGMKSFENKFIDPEEWLYNNSVYIGRCE